MSSVFVLSLSPQYVIDVALLVTKKDSYHKSAFEVYWGQEILQFPPNDVFGSANNLICSVV